MTGEFLSALDFIGLEWIRLMWNDYLIEFVIWSAVLIAVGYAIGVAREKKQGNDSRFKTDLVNGRIEAINDIRPVLSEMTTFERIKILDSNDEVQPEFGNSSTIAALHGISRAGEYGIKLNSLISKHDASLTITQKAALSNLNNLQYSLITLIAEVPDNGNKDLIFAFATLPISNTLKEYIRKIIASFDDCMNKEKYKAEPLHQSKWKRMYQKYKKQTDGMYQTVRQFVAETLDDSKETQSA